MNEGLELTFLQRGHTNDQKVYEGIIDIIKYQGKANQNNSELSLPICRLSNILKMVSIGKCMEKLEL